MGAVELVPAHQREGGAALGSVVNHTYTDGKDNDLIHWLPNQLAHNLEKRSTLMQLEAFVSEYVASNDWRYIIRKPLLWEIIETTSGYATWFTAGGCNPHRSYLSL